MSDRLNELQRQRALVQEHLDWLDREIAAESGNARPSNTGKPSHLPPGMAVPVRPTTVARPAAAAAPAHAEAAAADILAQYQVEPQTVHSNVKRGCFMYFFLAFLLVGLATLGLYLYSIRK